MLTSRVQLSSWPQMARPHWLQNVGTPAVAGCLAGPSPGPGDLWWQGGVGGLVGMSGCRTGACCENRMRGRFSACDFGLGEGSSTGVRLTPGHPRLCPRTAQAGDWAVREFYGVCAWPAEPTPPSVDLGTGGG